MKINLQPGEKFEQRHIGTSSEDQKEMLRVIGASSLDQLIEQTVPSAIRLKNPLSLPAPVSEFDFLKDFKAMVSQNKLFRSYIGLGYYNTITPPVILRNILENPGWYTAYTPYQAEIAQGRLEMLINYQTMVTELTGMELANASLLDEATAAAEAMTLLHSSRKASKKNSEVFLVSDTCFPQTIDVLITRATPLGIELRVKEITEEDLSDPSVFGVLLQTPDRNGQLIDAESLIAKAHANDLHVAVASDLLALTLVKSPGEMGADVVIGSSQRFGVPMGFGGPHAGFF